MNDDERRALEALRFDWADTPDDVWNNSPFHVDGLHTDVMRHIAGGIREAHTNVRGSPVGVAIQGQRGVGKTHMLGMVRERVQADGGYFFLVSLYDGSAFWESVREALIGGLLRAHQGCERQLTIFLRRLASQAAMLAGVQAAVVGDTPLSPRDLNSFIGALRRLDPQVGLECQDIARALVLSASPDHELQDVGYTFLQSADELEPGERSTWGFRQGPKTPQLVVRDMSRLLALTGPSVVAVDQIDALIALSITLPAGSGDTSDNGHGALLVEQIAGGLMALREVTQRTLTVVACLPKSWILIKDRAVNTVRDRFREALQLHRIPSAEIGQAIIEKRFTARFQDVEFTPPYPTWPVPVRAFKDAPEFTPRGLLQRVDAHVQACLRSGTASEMDELLRAEEGVAALPSPPPADDLAAIDARFTELRNGAGVAAALDPKTEDEAMPELLAAGLTAWITERGDGSRAFSQDPPPGGKPPLHARLRRNLDEHTEDESHWSLRAIASGNARAVQCRIRNACTMAGLREGATKRKLYLLRNTPWPSGAVTRQVVTAFTDEGGVTLPISSEDLKTFAAVRQLLAERDPNLQAWLLARRPASGSELLRTVLADAAGEEDEVATTDRPTTVDARGLTSTVDTNDRPAAEHESTVGHEPTIGHEPTMEDAPAAAASVDDGVPAINVGVAIDSQRPVRIALESLRKHTAIFAGSGSGKTVLIRRLVEECALQGVSAIVLDPNNDLARLGDGWPASPAQWSPGDADKATEYLAGTDVVVWTPRREAGRPLSFQPLPDFRTVLDDLDEFDVAIDAAVAALAPRAKVDGKTTKASHGQAVLRESLRFFARQGGSELKSYIDLLSDLPEGASALGRADRIAAELAETLTAAMINDPLFGGDGAPVDPGLLLTPRAGKRARVSVISLVGLPADEQRQGFVNQLQMALFAWIKKHPVGDRPLGGLFVMDEAQTFASSGALTVCTQSTVALFSQARKYGLGLVFATQAPKALHNQISGNAATQFFGFLNSPAQIEAANVMAKAKGSAVVDISRLATGQFYAAGPDFPFQKLRTPLCLSHHPKSPLTPEEVIDRARR